MCVDPTYSPGAGSYPLPLTGCRIQWATRRSGRLTRFAGLRYDITRRGGSGYDGRAARRRPEIRPAENRPVRRAFRRYRRGDGCDTHSRVSAGPRRHRARRDRFADRAGRYRARGRRRHRQASHAPRTVRARAGADGDGAAADRKRAMPERIHISTGERRSGAEYRFRASGSRISIAGLQSANRTAVAPELSIVEAPPSVGGLRRGAWRGRETGSRISGLRKPRGGCLRGSGRDGGGLSERLERHHDGDDPRALYP